MGGRAVEVRSPFPLNAASMKKLALLALPFLASVASAQYDPPNGLYGKIDATDIRVMTWNVEDNLRTGEPKVEATNSWNSLARIVAALRPDVLLLQEAGDNNCGGCVDTTSELTQVIELFFHGGVDPWLGGNVTSYVQKYAPGYDLPYIFVSTRSDAFNRNVIVSRFPFTDLNGDTVPTYSDAPFTTADDYAPGLLGNGIIRGLQMAEIDLPDATYSGDLVVMNMHLRSGGSSSDRAERLSAGQNIAYLVDYWYGGAGTGSPDPNSAVGDFPAATTILDADTPVVLGGDWNEDELNNGRKGPVEWVERAQTTGGTDGTDRDRSDSTYDDARSACFSGDRSTQGTSKLDYVLWQDSIATLKNEFVFNANAINSGCGGNFPTELLGFPSGLPQQTTTLASDHRPVIVDLALPLVPPTPPTPPRRSTTGGRPLGGPEVIGL